MARDGVEIRLNTTVVGARREGDTKWLDLVSDDARYSIPVDEILLSAGRTPNVEELSLESAGIAFEPLAGIEVDEYLRTTNVDVYAAGDVCQDHHFTHIATACAQLAVHNAFGAQLEPPSHMLGPWCTYCDPEIAHIGMHMHECHRQATPVTCYTVMMQDVDRAITDGGRRRLREDLRAGRNGHDPRRDHRRHARQRTHQRNVRHHGRQHRNAPIGDDPSYLSDPIRCDSDGGPGVHE